MLEVNTKAVFLRERPLYRREKVFIAIYNLATFAAHEVVVMPFLSVVVDKLVTQFAFEHTTGFFQQLQRAVNC
jgi:hypothetical protein